jgi:CDP-diacylglycerol---glycerol-3-phosphate 3-phosphatidyltransferase
VNLPNSITLSRLVLTAVFVAGSAFESTAGHWIALVSFVIAAISDFVDGWLARKMGLVTPMGKLLDPLADKILVGAAFVYLSAEGLCPVWVTVMILAREFLVTGLRQIAVEAGGAGGGQSRGNGKPACSSHFASPASSGSPSNRSIRRIRWSGYCAIFRGPTAGCNRSRCGWPSA